MNIEEYKKELDEIAELACEQYNQIATADEYARVALKLVERIATLMNENIAAPCDK